MKKIFKSLIPGLIFVSIFLMLIMPVIVLAQTKDLGLIPCDNSEGNKCDFIAFMALVNKVINFVLFKMVIPLAAIMFAYAGFLMVTAGGEAAHARQEAKSIFTNVVIGLVFAVAAWLIISTILAILGYDGSWIGLKIGV